VRAVKLLGWTEIPVNIVDLEAVTRGEFAEHAVRKDFTLSEAVAIKRALEPLEKITAKERHLGTAAASAWAPWTAAFVTS
jgi:ParB-like chromosome segregation protein Spo0J